MSLAWYESDGTTPLATIALGTIGPGESYTGKNDGVAKQYVLKNTGANEVTGVAIEIEAVSTFPMNQYLLIATGESQPSSESFVDYQDDDLSIGTLAAGATAKIWVDASVPVAAPRQLAQMASLRAYGSTEAEGS